MSKVEDFHKLLFTFQPHEIIYSLFDYFAASLEKAPMEKIDEFFIHFRSGIEEMMEKRKKEW